VRRQSGPDALRPGMYEASHVGEVPAELRRGDRFSAHSIVYIQSSGVRSFHRRLRDVSQSGVFLEDSGAQSDPGQQMAIVSFLDQGPGFQLHRRLAWLARAAPAGIGFGFAPRVEVLKAAK